MAATSKAFTRAHRLTSGHDFSRVFSGADRSADQYFTVLGKRNGFDIPRLGLAVSRRVAPRAVDRNRLRRLARESFRHLELAPLDFVVMARQQAVRAENPALRSSLDRHFTRLSERARQA